MSNMDTKELKKLLEGFMKQLDESNADTLPVLTEGRQLLIEDVEDPCWLPTEKSLNEASSILLEDPKAPMKLRGLFQEAGKRNQNGRVYPLNVLVREVERLQPIIEQKRLTGEMDHPETSKIRMKEAAFYITGLWVEGDKVYGEIEPTTGHLGMEMRARIRDKSLFGISSRGVGSLQREGNDIIVQEDYHMLTFDAVTDPSVYKAFLYNETSNDVTTEDNNRAENITNNFFELMDKYFSQKKLELNND